MSFAERVIDYSVGKGGEFAEKAIVSSAKVAAVAGVLGIGITVAGLGIMAAEHTPEIVRASKYVAGKLVR